MILQARAVRCPRIRRCCDSCGRVLDAHIYLYGRAHDTEKPYPMRLCLREGCIGSPRDAKVLAAIAKLQEAL